MKIETDLPDPPHPLVNRRNQNECSFGDVILNQWTSTKTVPDDDDVTMIYNMSNR